MFLFLKIYLKDAKKNKEFNPLDWTLKERVLATSCFFDVFSRKLTLEELCKWCLGGAIVDFEEVEMVQEYLLDISLDEESLKMTERADYLIKLSKKRSWIFRYIPFVDGVFLCNYLYFGIADEESDLDLLIVTRHKRIFTAKYLASVVLFILRWKRWRKKVKDRFCLSFWITHNNLDFRQYLLADYDIYFYYWLIALQPLYEGKINLKTLQNFNAWNSKNLSYQNALDDIGTKNNSDSFVKKIGEIILSGFLGEILERLFKEYSLRKEKKLAKSKNQENRSVIVSDTVLKYHENDQRKIYRDLYEKNLKTAGLSSRFWV